MFSICLFQQARQSKHLPPCLLDGQSNPCLETPLVTQPIRFAIAVGGLPLIVKADNLTTRLGGHALCFS
jgi:hypothetical protein